MGDMETTIRSLVELCDELPEAGFANALDMVLSWTNDDPVEGETYRTGDVQLDATIERIIGDTDVDELIEIMDSDDDSFND